jgi:alcohol dehydrogenase class IV
MTPVPHGAICAALLAPVIEANVAALQRLDKDAAQDALEKFRGAAMTLTGRDDAKVGNGVDWIRETVQELSIPGLAGFGIDLDAAAAADVVAQAKASSSMKGNPVTLSDAELHGVLDAAR